MNEHPAEQLQQGHFNAAAEWADYQLSNLGHAFVDLQPDDGTTYRIVVVRPTLRPSFSNPVPDESASIWVGSSFGAIYPWSPENHMHWDYVDSHFLAKPHEWTARVLARFLNTLADKMRAAD